MLAVTGVSVMPGATGLRRRPGGAWVGAGTGQEDDASAKGEFAHVGLSLPEGAGCVSMA